MGQTVLRNEAKTWVVRSAVPNAPAGPSRV